ncbi:MAG: ammonium transporter [Gracilibacteraceae bacterium]|jgi:Amt family ammonium transporter|nr:ammonium transporter [Gracilibacteraceae bacterium]
MNYADTAFLLICTVLVIFMTPGLALFYGGLERRKNMVSNMMNVAFNMGLGVVMWIAFGYTMCFGGNTGGVLGGLNHFFLSGLNYADPSPDLATVPSMVYVVFLMAFAVITPVIIAGSVSGRMKFKALFIFTGLWSLVVLYPMFHMVWGEGGLIGSGWLGALDFAGGDAIHISSGVSGLVLCILLGKRRGFEHKAYNVHNIPLVVLGASIVWIGWFGFNGGCALEASAWTGHVFMTTAAASGAAVLSWMIIDVVKSGKPTIIGLCTAAIVGLVAVTPAAGFVSVWAALVIGLCASPFCFYGMYLVKRILKIDDTLDAFGCHGLGGIFGGIMTGIFANPAVNAAPAGLFYGGAEQFFRNLAGVGVAILYAVAGTLICAGITRLFGKMRVDHEDELRGLDIAEHGEKAYPSFSGLD